MKASARLIAGLRATENNATTPLYTDQYSAAAAKIHGKLLAEKFMAILPQLRDMVAARTKDIDDLLLLSVNSGITQILTIGVGFDFRIFRLLNERKDIKIFELDLPDMLAERERILFNIKGLPDITRESIAVNLEFEDLDKIVTSKGFDPSVATLFIMEGISMYFNEHINIKILSAVYRLIQNINSLFWIDVVDKSVIQKEAGLKVQEFLNGMEKLGEPFIFGLDNHNQFFSDLSFTVCKKVPSSFYITGESDPIFDLYNFFVLKRSNI